MEMLKKSKEILKIPKIKIMRGLMSYFAYPKTVDTAANFTNWKCTICHSEDPSEKGGTVAHLEGEKHADHRDCILDWHKFNAICPSCQIPTSIDRITPIQKRILTFIQRVRPKILKKAKKWVVCPSNQAFSGLALAVSGMLLRKKHISLVGCWLQFVGLQRALKIGSHRSQTSNEVRALTREILVGRNVQRNQQVLLALILNYPNHYPALGDGKRENILRLNEVALNDMRGDFLVKVWKVSAAALTLYYWMVILRK